MVLLAVGTFNTPELCTVRFDPTSHRLELVSTSDVVGKHSWLSTAVIRPSASRALVGSAEPPTHLYATCWTEPPSVAAYRIRKEPGHRGPSDAAGFELLNTAPTAARSGYVTIGQPANHPHPVLYTISGPGGEVIGIDAETGAFDAHGRKHAKVIPDSGGRIQELDCVAGRCSRPGRTLKDDAAGAHHDSGVTGSGGGANAMPKLDGSGGKNNGDFGGLRHGAHGVDLSVDGRVAFVPDIGRNCIWVYDVDPDDGTLSLAQKYALSRANDGPRHTIAHPGGRYLYCLQEHSSYVDVFEIFPAGHGGDGRGTRIEWRQGVRIIPRSEDETLYWADEVRVSAPTDDGSRPFLYASTRGLAKGTRGWVAVFQLDRDGAIVAPASLQADEVEVDVEAREEGWSVAMWQTPTSGGWADAIEPAPTMLVDGSGRPQHYAALTDSEEGVLRILELVSPAGGPCRIEEVATLDLGRSAAGELREAATAVWLG
ncbi:uncharacterized protein PFL1_06637 [Pseudozyma flocculosa PF-1]|uniref:Related to muconate cycloisomerase n=2 Tax=Pseudozyma flocculosa TaxID=84751 RepID=A0A5C3F7W6_9BASI|nr:uncharacterized protein PFL1_06637 [Pseudozyma flocculosa PF-1]EPQ25770.1 hypothetical protein PFL1_06637 [Pseudozyma flocculosa PF-1]SPO40533.1 related to muconate cycloisomerase [Pseudozyma flocculosa]